MPTPPTTKGRKIYKVNAASQALLIKLMLDGLHNTDMLADETGLSPVTIRRYCYELHRVGAAFIDHFEQDRMGRDQTKVYKIGVGIDAVPRRLSNKQRQARHRASVKLLAHQTALTIHKRSSNFDAQENAPCPALPAPSSCPKPAAGATPSPTPSVVWPGSLLPVA